MQQISDCFKAKYQRKRLAKYSTERDTWPPFQVDSYISLALVHQNKKSIRSYKQVAKLNELRIRGAFSEVVSEATKLDSVQQIFFGLDLSNTAITILIEGHPGIGKTTLSKEICLEWANNQLLTKDILVFLLMLRDPKLQNVTTTEELLKYYVSADHAECILDYLKHTSGNRVTIIIDGFDELSDDSRQKSYFRNLIEGDELPKARIVVTSRPFASTCLHGCVDRKIEILGFDKFSKDEYMLNALKDSPSDLSKLKDHFQQFPKIEAMCYIPLNMVIIVFLCLLQHLPTTATEMYENLILHVICRHLSREGEAHVKYKNLKCLPKPVLKVLLDLEHLSFTGLQNDKIVFTVEDLPMLSNNPTCYGLLQSTECYSAHSIGSPTLSFNFLHLGLQEYFAARYIVYSSDELLITILNSVLEGFSDTLRVRFSNVLILYCGITGGKSETFRDYLRTMKTCKNQSRLPTKPGPLEEYDFGHENNSNSGQHIEPEEIIDFEYSIMQRLYAKHAISCFPQNSGPVKKYDFGQHVKPENNNVVTKLFSQDIENNPLHLLYLFQCFYEAQDEELCKDLAGCLAGSLVNLNNQKLIPYQVSSLGFFLSKCHEDWKTIDLSSCNIGDHGISILQNYLRGKMGTEQKRTLCLGRNDLTAASSPIIGNLIEHIQPYMLRLDNNKVNCLKDIASAVAATGCLKVLHIRQNSISAQATETISDMIVTCLEVLDLFGNEIGDHGAAILSDAISKTKTLQALDIGCNRIGFEGGIKVANAIANNNTLEKLFLYHNTLNSSAATALAVAANSNQTLCTLDVTNCSLTDSEMELIANAIIDKH